MANEKADESTRGVNRAALEVTEREPFPSLDALASVIQLTGATDPDVAKLRPESVMQRGVMESMERSGFIDQQQRSN